jgi:methyl-accepting chemotaxis protein
MFSKMTIGFRITLGFLVVVVLMAALGTLAVISLKEMQSEFSEVGHDGSLAMTRLGLMRAAVDKQALLVRDISSYEDLSIQKAAIKELKEADAAFHLASEGLAKQAPRFDRPLQLLLQDAAKKYAAVNPPLREAIAFVQDAEYDQAKEKVYTVLRPMQYDLGQTLDKAVGELTKSAEESVRDSEAKVNKLMILFLLCTLAGAGFAIAIEIWLRRGIVTPLHQAVDLAKRIALGDLTAKIEVTSSDETGQLMQALKEMNESLVKIVAEVRVDTETIATASNQIAAGNLDLSSRTEQQASSLQETASSMEELTSTVKQNSENAHQANDLASSASEVAVKGGAVVSQVVETMGSINTSSRKIVDIISVIDGIAFQTNILALNAAVEAARAGEQGRGFAVVASEVRNLAQRSAAAAKEIKALIDDSVEKVEIGSSLVDEAGTTMQDIVASVKRVTDIMSEITAASNEQSAGIEQVNRAISQMDQVTQQNASLVEQAAAAAESMKDQASNLVRVVSVFKLDQPDGQRITPALTMRQPSPRRLQRASSAAPMKAVTDIEMLR